MKNEKISDAVGSIDEKYIEEATLFEAEMPPAAVKKTRSRAFRWGAVAACLAVMIAVGSTAVAVAAEAREYSTAVSFFEENGLSTSGLSRAEIKEVYRDIVTQRFEYGKTAEVIMRTVPGYEIVQAEPTPDELEMLWSNNVSNNASIYSYNGRPLFEKGYDYRIRTVERYKEENGQQVYVGFDKSVLECYYDKTLVWMTDFDGIVIHGSAHTSVGTAVWGINYSVFTSSQNPIIPVLALVDENGKVMWEKTLNHGFKYENIVSVIDNGDKTIAVIGRNSASTLCLSQFDDKGNQLSYKGIDVGNLGVGKAVKLGDGYLVQLGNIFYDVRHTARLIKLDKDGNITDNFTYEENGVDYYITDMAEFGGKIYLSAYAVPTQKYDSGRYDIENILRYIFEKRAENGQTVPEISSEELTPFVRDNFTAVLLVCDTESGAPATFYSVGGSLGAELQAVGGKLEWNVQTIASTYFSPYTNSFTIGGKCKVYRYSFDGAGALVDQKDTGDTVPFRR